MLEGDDDCGNLEGSIEPCGGAAWPRSLAASCALRVSSLVWSNRTLRQVKILDRLYSIIVALNRQLLNMQFQLEVV
jgi:hypothetical protein